jgi:hypothetical protein
MLGLGSIPICEIINYWWSSIKDTCASNHGIGFDKGLAPEITFYLIFSFAGVDIFPKFELARVALESKVSLPAVLEKA